MKKLKFALGLAFLTLLVSVNLVAQQTEPQAQEIVKTQEVPKELKERLELYWKSFINEDWEKVFEMTTLPRSDKDDHITKWKRQMTLFSRKEESIVEIRLEEKMEISSFRDRTKFPTFGDSGNRYLVRGCTKIKYKDGTENWFKNNSVFLQNQENEWLVADVSVLYTSLKDGGFTPCDKDISLLPIKIEGK